MDELLNVVHGPAPESIESLNADDEDGDTITLDLTEKA